jgi:Zn-dependent peptidase ImmA (M78 family)/transcriptional regulator with XRE-family HTH domain
MKMNPQAPVNGHMVTLAREYRGLTQSALAASSGVTQQAIQRLESGIPTAVGDDRLEKIAESLSFPAEFFSSNEVRMGFGSSSYFYRKKVTTAAERNYISGTVNLVRIHLSSMLKVVDATGSIPLPRVLTADGHTPEQAANTVRAAWNLPDGPIHNLTNFVEKAGVIIVECPFGTRSIDGTGLWINGLPPLILLNDALPPDRLRFTIAHELGHLVMHDVPHERMEDEADAFASELLMQEVSFRVNVAQVCHGRPTVGQLLQLKPYWKVAVSAMVMRLHRIGRINDSEKRSLFIMLSTNKMLKNEPQPFERERPRFFKAIMDAALSGFSSKNEAVVTTLKMYESDFKHLYGALEAVNRPALRVVV